MKITASATATLVYTLLVLSGGNFAKAEEQSKRTLKTKGKKGSKAQKFYIADPLLEIDLNVFGEVHPSKMDNGPDQKLYFNGGTDSKAYQGDVEGKF